MTLTQKILFAHAFNPSTSGVKPGDVIHIKVDWTIASELAWNGMDKTYSALGRPTIHDRDRFYLAIDHTVDPVTLSQEPRVQRLTALSRSFAKESQLSHFYDANETILHTKFYRDLVQPGELVLGADSHTSSHGGLGAFAIGLGGADITVAMVLGESWLEVPEAIAVEYTGQLSFGFGGKDVILKTLGELGRNTVAMERSVEYMGEGAQHFSTDTRFTIANMTAEFGGLNGIFHADHAVSQWLEGRDSHNENAHYFTADEDAPYLERFHIDLSRMVPQVAKPFSPDNVYDATEVLGMPLDGAFIGACTTTEEELVLAGMILEQVVNESTAIKETTNRLMVPGDLNISRNLNSSGLMESYRRAGFRIGPPGCSMCLGVASEKASPGEVWLTSQNRNYQNRMGAGSMAWLASAATVAASAPGLKLKDPRPYLENIDQDRFNQILGRVPNRPIHTVHLSEPEHLQLKAAPPVEKPAFSHDEKTDIQLTGLVYRFGDHIDTDAIIPGEFCHLTELSELGEKCFHYVAPDFYKSVQAGQNIIVAGEGWGSGSSREQAVWALQGAGIKLVIAKSFAFIHKRNLVNEALPFFVIEDDRFYELAEDNATLSADLKTGTITVSNSNFQASPPSPITRSLQDLGGIIQAIRSYGDTVFAHLTQS
jgi:aconitate hydratase/homoaconitate hydratase